MRQVFVHKAGNPGLLLFFAGWGMDERLVDVPWDGDCDCMVCFDYRTMDFDASLLAAYRSVRVAAWSMGVWAAGQVLSSVALPWAETVAFNGTPWPVDDRRGIPAAMFQATLDNFSERTLAKFRRRMCGSEEELQAFMAHASLRPPVELRDELSALAGIAGWEPAPWTWDCAFIGARDRIFPAANQLRAWEGTAHRLIDAAHYDARWLRLLLTKGGEGAWISN